MLMGDSFLVKVEQLCFSHFGIKQETYTKSVSENFYKQKKKKDPPGPSVVQMLGSSVPQNEQDPQLCEATPLCVSSSVGRSVHFDFGTIPSPSTSTSNSTSNARLDSLEAEDDIVDRRSVATSFLLEGAQTEFSLEELRGSILEGCCPGDGIAAGALSLLTSAVTPTMLSIPLAFSMGGIPFAVGSIVCCIAMTLVSVRFLALASASALSDDYETVALYFFGIHGQLMTRCIMFFYNFGCSVVYLRFIYDSLSSNLQVMGAAYLPTWVLQTTGPVMLLCAFVMLVTPLTFNSRLGALRSKGFVSNLLIMFIIGCVVYRYFSPLSVEELERRSQERVSDETNFADVNDLQSMWHWILPFLFAGPIYVFSYEVQSNVMSVFRDLSDPTPNRILACLCLALAGATLMYFPLGIFGSWSYPSSASGNLLLNYNVRDDHLMLFCQLALCFSAAISFVFVLFPCRFAFFMLVSDGSTTKVPRVLRVRIGIFLSALATFFALFVPDVAVVVSVLGSLCSATLSMTIPALMAFRMRASGTYCTSIADTAASWLMLIGGILFTIIGTLIALVV